MAQSKKTPGAGTPRALENVALQADISRDTAPALQLQAFRIQQRFSFSPALANAIASMAYGTAENARRA